MSYYDEDIIGRALSSAVTATETMNDLDVDPDVVKARLKVIREIADSLGIEIKIPSNKVMMIKRILGNKYD